METQEGQWVCYLNGTRIPADQCPPDADRFYMVDYTSYDSPEAYQQIQENKRLQGINSKALLDTNPGGYPPCSSVTPVGPEDQCGSESCNLHNILWLEFYGCSHEEAVGLTAVYNYSEGHPSAVAEALGGLDEFNQLNENGAEVPGMRAWYTAHKPLVQYILEAHESDSLLDYWWAAQIPNYRIHRYVEWSMLVIKGSDGAWAPHQLAGFPLVFTEDSFPDVSQSDPSYDRTDYWLTHHWASIRFDIG